MPSKNINLVKESTRPIKINGIWLEDHTMGADPEFRFKGKNASELGLKFEDKFGLDGASSIAELRPRPQFNPLNLTEVIRETMIGGYHRFEKIRNLDWLGGSYQEGHAVGGHIHFGSNPNEEIGLKIQALNKCLAPTVLMLENTEAAKQRRRSSYGSIKNGNRCFDIHEEYNGFEYRPLPSWLVSRNFTAGVLCLAKAIMFDAHNKSLRDGLAKRLKFINLDAEFENNFQDCNKIFFINKIPTIYRIVSKLTLFPVYEGYINYLFNYIHQGRTWEDDKDIKSRWGIQPLKKMVEKVKKMGKLTFDKIWTDSTITLPFQEQ